MLKNAHEINLKSPAFNMVFELFLRPLKTLHLISDRMWSKISVTYFSNFLEEGIAAKGLQSFWTFLKQSFVSSRVPTACTMQKFKLVIVQSA